MYTVGVRLAQECTNCMGGYQVYCRLSYQVCGGGSQVECREWFWRSAYSRQMVRGRSECYRQALALTLDLPMFAGKTVTYITDQPKKKGEKFFTSIKKALKVGKDGKAKVVIQPNGGIIIE